MANMGLGSLITFACLITKNAKHAYLDGSLFHKGIENEY